MESAAFPCDCVRASSRSVGKRSWAGFGASFIPGPSNEESCEVAVVPLLIATSPLPWFMLVGPSTAKASVCEEVFF